MAIIITLYMDKIYKIRKIGGDKIALLGLFVISLLIAHMIVVSRSAILLSAPIILPRTGLSVSMPEGNGWKSEKQWRNSENRFSVSSTFALNPKNPTAQANCVYILTTETIDPQNLFEQKAFEVEGEIVKVDRITNDILTFDWAYIENPKISLIFIFGTARLSYNRRLDIEVKQVMNDPEMAERAFKKIVQNLNFDENQLTKTDSQTITQIKNKSIIQKEYTIILEITTADDIINKFPERAEYIQRTNKMLQ
jgi:hypothetical protein